MERHSLNLTIVILAALMLSPPVWSYHYPWDQGHDVTVPEEPSDPNEPDNDDPCNNSSQGSPVYLRTGHLIWTETDISLRGLAPITLNRTYNSMDPRDGMFGKGWHGNCEAMLLKTEDWELDSSNSPNAKAQYVLRLANGKRYNYLLDNDGNTLRPDGVFGELVLLDNGATKLDFATDGHQTFSVDGKVIERVDGNGNAVRYEYDDGRLVGISDSIGLSISFIYNTAGRVAEATDNAGRTWQYFYNLNGALSSVVDPLDAEKMYTYQDYKPLGDGHTYSQLTKVIGPAARVLTQVVYDGERVASYTEGQNKIGYSRNGTGTEVTKTDSVGSTWKYTLDDLGKYIAIQAPSGSVEQFAYNSEGKLIEYKDKLGSTISLDYDDYGRLAIRVTPDGTTRWTYHGESRNIASIITPGGKVTSYTYDNKNNPSMVKDPNGDSLKPAFFDNGRLASITYSDGSVVSYQYNNFGWLTKVTDSLNRESLFAYDDRGNTVSISNPEGETRTIQYDLLDRIIAHKDPLDSEARYTYDPMGRLEKVVLSSGSAQSYSYDSFGRVESISQFGGGIKRYSYNADNSKSMITDASGTVFGYTYDSSKNVVSMSLDGALYQSYAYDPVGQLLSASNENGAVNYTYDLLGRVVGEQSNGEMFTYSYDNEGNLVQVGALGGTLDYLYHNSGLVSSVTSEFGTTAYDYDAAGRLVSLSRPNGLDTIISYDLAGQVLQINHGSHTGEVYDYQYDAAGRLVSWDELDVDRTYSYDKVGRLDSEKSGAEITNYAYDSMGNRTNRSAEFDGGNRILQDDGHTYSYDAKGNRISRTSKINGEHEVYDYNALNQLVSYTRHPSNSSSEFLQQTVYRYGPFGRRWYKDDSELGERKYIWIGNSMVAEKQNGVYEAKYLQGIVSREGGPYFVHSDHLGTPGMLSDSSGNVAWKATYDAFGATKEVDGAVDQNFRFPGQYFDSESSLHYNRFRDYDPSLGRYLQSDPVGILGGLNTYTYVNNSPLNYADPLGLWAVVDDLIAMGIGGAVGIVGQGVGDLVSWELSGWEDYLGAAIGGAAGGEAFLYTGPVGAGLVGGAVTNASKQGLKLMSGKNCEFDWASLGFDTAIGGAIGFIPGIPKSGVNSGRGSWGAVSKQMYTKLGNGQIKKVSASTLSKMFGYKVWDGLSGEGAAVVAGFGGERLGLGNSGCPCE